MQQVENRSHRTLVLRQLLPTERIDALQELAENFGITVRTQAVAGQEYASHLTKGTIQMKEGKHTVLREIRHIVPDNHEFVLFAASGPKRFDTLIDFTIESAKKGTLLAF